MLQPLPLLGVNPYTEVGKSASHETEILQAEQSLRRAFRIVDTVVPRKASKRDVMLPVP